MLARFSLAILFAVLVAASRPIPTGGSRDLLAVGVLVEETGKDGKAMQRVCALGMPEGNARAAYESLLRTPSREALVQGSTVYAPFRGDAGPGRAAGPGPRVLGLVYYGTASRAGRSVVLFTDGKGPELDGTALAWEAAVSLLDAPATVSAAAGKVLLATEDLESYRDALEVLGTVEADAASAEAAATAGDPAAPVERRVVAIQVLKGARLGGARHYAELFGRLAKDPDPLIRDVAR